MSHIQSRDTNSLFFGFRFLNSCFYKKSETSGHKSSHDLHVASAGSLVKISYI